MEAYIERGEAWHVGISPMASQYIFTTEAEAVSMCAHLNRIRNDGVRVRTQAEINEFHRQRREAAGLTTNEVA